MGTIEIAKTEVVFDNRWLKMMKTTYRRYPADGSPFAWGEYLYASRTGEPGVKSSAVVVCAIHQGDDGVNRLVITDEYRIPLQGREYGFPAGLIEKGMSAEDTAVKELLEETGLVAVDVQKALTTQTMVSSAGMSNEGVVMVFLTCKGTPSKEHLEPIEDINTHLFDIDQVRQLVKQPHLFGAKAYMMMYAMIFAGKIDFPSMPEDILEASHS